MNSDQQSLCSYIRNKNNNIGPTAAAHVQLSKKKKKKWFPEWKLSSIPQ